MHSHLELHYYFHLEGFPSKQLPKATLLAWFRNFESRDCESELG